MDDAVSETIAIIFIIFLVVILSAVIFAFSSGFFSSVKPVSFVVPAFSSETIGGKGIISLSNKGGNVMYLDPLPKLHYNVMGVYLDTPQGTFRATPVPGTADFRPGTPLYIFKDANGYRITDDPSVISSRATESIIPRSVGVQLVDENSQVLIARWGAVPPSGPGPTPTTTSTTLPTTSPTSQPTTGPITTLPTTVPTTVPPPPPAPPVVDFTGTPVTGPVPLEVAFSDKSTGNPDRWAWNFGDGTGAMSKSSEQDPVHTYTTTGIYSVTLTAGNAAGTNTTTRSRYVSVTEPETVSYIELETKKTSRVLQGGALGARVTGRYSYIVFGRRSIDLNPGDEIRLVIGLDPEGHIDITPSQIQTFDFDNVRLYVNSVDMGSDTVSKIWVNGYDGLTSTLTIEVPSVSAWTQFSVNGVPMINGESSAKIRVLGIQPTTKTLLLENQRDHITLRGGAKEYTLS